MKYDNEVKFTTEAPIQLGNESNKYGDVGFQSGGCADSCNTYKDPYASKSSPGLSFNLKLIGGLGIAIGAAAMLYKPGSAAKIVKTASETTAKADIGKVASQMRKKVQQQSENIKSNEPPSPPSKQSIIDKIKISMKTVDGEKFKIKADFKKSAFGIDKEKFNKQMSEMDKAMKENFAKHQPTADEQKKQMNEAFNKITEDFNKYFADMKKKQKTSKQTDQSTAKEQSGNAKTEAKAEEPSFFDKLMKESGFDSIFDKHETGGFEQVTDKKGMSLQEARRILQFDASNPNIKKDEITTNFRKISRANHPDLGGSPYVAAKINEAREALLKHNKKTQRRR